MLLLLGDSLHWISCWATAMNFLHYIPDHFAGNFSVILRGMGALLDCPSRTPTKQTSEFQIAQRFGILYLCIYITVIKQKDLTSAVIGTFLKTTISCLTVNFYILNQSHVL